MDMGNFKFRFPRLHKWHFLRRHSLQEYNQRYVAQADGMIGDISSEKRWHEHFSKSKLAGMLTKAGFVVLLFDGHGFFGRPLGLLKKLIPLSALKEAICRLERADAFHFSTGNLLCLAAKPPVQPGES